MSGFAMRIQGHLSSIPDDFDVLKIYPRSEQARKFPPDASFKPGEVSRLRELFSATPRILLPYTGSSERRSVMNTIDRFKPDCVIASGFHVIPFSPPGTRLIYDSHNVEWHLSMRLHGHSKSSPVVKLHRLFTTLKLKRSEIRLVKKSDYVIACSKTDGDYLSMIRGKPVPVVNNGVDTTYWDIPRNPLKGNLLFSGDMSYNPNVVAAGFIVREVLPILISKGWSGKIIFCGKDPAPSVKALGSSYIEVTGTVDDMREHYSRAEILLAPMRIGSGTPLKVISAMAAGVPVITTTRISESLGLGADNPLLQADLPESIAEKIMLLSSDTNMAKRLSDQGKRIAEEKFSWSVVGKQFWEIVGNFLR